jgi:hypothetical protein
LSSFLHLFAELGRLPKNQNIAWLVKLVRERLLKEILNRTVTTGQ